MAATRRATIASGVAAFVLGAGYLALTWDAWLTNFQVRWMCDEDRPFVLMRRTDVDALAIPGEIARADARALAVFGRMYPEVVVPGPRESRRPRYELAERWPTVLRDYWGFRVLRTDFSVVDRDDRNRVLGTTSLFRRVERGAEGVLRTARQSLGPPPEQCLPSDRAEFVRSVLRPPEG